jgi:hypothetical protein
LALLLALGCGLAVVSVSDSKVAQWLFVNTTYYCLMALVVCWAGTYLHAARGLGWQGVVAWARENWRGLMVAFGVTAVAGFAVEPAFRMLSDEANLVGVSKNLFASKTSTFTVSGKYYYGSYWDVDVAIDRRPTLFPFLVSLLHSVRGYSHENAFLLNLLMLPVFLLVSYRLGKSLGGETFGVVAALFVAAHPVTLISIRSSGFDFLAACFAVLSLKSLLDYCREQSSSRMMSANGRLRASLSACCMSVTPPPEYSISDIGGRSMNRTPTFESLFPCRNCTTVGTESDGSYPGNPNPSPSPEVWLVSMRGVTGPSVVNWPPSSFQEVRIVLMSVSRVNRPSCTARNTAIAATGLLIDAAWNIVSVFSGAPVAMSAIP